MVAESRDGTLQHGGAGGALTDFARELRSQTRIGRLAHHAQRLLDAVLWNKAQEWRLFKLHGQTLPQCAVENGIAGGICEVREDEGVLVRQSWRAVKIKEARDGERQHRRGGRRDDVPAPGERVGSALRGRNATV